MKRYRTKPRYVEAMKYNLDEAIKLLKWVRDCGFPEAHFTNEDKLLVPSKIPGLPPVPVIPGEYAIWDRQGDFYPCSAEAFENFYETVDNEDK